MEAHRSPPLFSVVIPTRHRAQLLERAVRSVLDQTVSDIEILVIDDGPDRETRSIIEDLQSDRVSYHPQEHRGAAAARNRGAALAQAPYLTFLDSDDQALPGWLSGFRQELADPSVGVVCCGVRTYRGEWLGDMEPEPRAPGAAGTPSLFLAGSFALRREIFVAVGGYWAELTYGENTELGLRLTASSKHNSWNIATISHPLVCYHQREEAFRPTEAQLRSRLASSRLLLARHAASLRKRDPVLLGKLLDTAGTRAARLGELKEARAFFQRSLVVDPTAWKHYVRLVATFWPALATRVWGGVQGREV